ncbi:AAA family ATPase [Nocardia cyriacigeorgica]|uniref:AAA family ATPase n=1 Tax=Nocardia cyriacigeorgica TaxID=135487 RepID=UPI002458207A|nr:AAA family ATPase [Nocardia cyriacigeorgica]
MSESPYARAAELYWSHGWRGVLPLPPKRKKSPPVGFTGRGGAYPSYADITEWITTGQFVAKDDGGKRQIGNIAVRAQDGTVGIDVDAYDGKRGDLTIAEAERRWGKLPKTNMSTSRTDGSGILWLRGPSGVEYRDVLEFPDLGLDGVEIVQPHHRYGLVWPSIHDRTGATYRWTDRDGFWLPEGEIPRVDDLPELPAAWVEGLKSDRVALPAANGDMVELTDGDLSDVVARKLDEALAALGSPGTRHDATCGYVAALVRLAETGEPGAASALQRLRAEFVAAVAASRQGGEREAASEFDRLVDSARGKIAADPSPKPAVLDDIPGATVSAASAPVSASEAADHHQRRVQHELALLRARAEARELFAADRGRAAEVPEPESLAEFLAVPDEDAAYRVEGLLPMGGRALLAAKYKCGKSTLIGNLLGSLVDGLPFLGRFPVATVERVALIDDELSHRQLRRWLREQGIGKADRVDLYPLRGRVNAFDILTPATRAVWAQRLAGVDVLVLDCLRPVLDALGLSEDKDAGRLLVALDQLLAEAGIGEAVLVHHMGHNGERSRGDSRLLDWPDALWKITRPGDDDNGPRYFSAMGRDVDVAEGLLDFTPQTRGLVYVGGNRTEADARRVLPDLRALLREHSAGLGHRDIEARLRDGGHGRNAVRRALEVARQEGITIVSDGPRNSRIHALNPSEK